MIRASLVLLVTVLLAACGNREYRTIEMNVEAGPRLAVSCTASFDGVIDRRRAGRVTGPSMHAYDIENLIEYLDANIRSMLTESESGPSLDVELRYAYSQGKAMRGFYTVVLVATFSDLSPIVLRGRHDVTNWAGSSSEFQRGITNAATQALDALGRFLSEAEPCNEPLPRTETATTL
ncbi:hypothetical protein [Wenzhouxiangella marina]|uniref:Uncharacterized protein n=1 Tax=Wenzhouxiangella marina TaxID=1579979 RepID=A0A0K0XW24_9GAMM|nr:hypothetical protein [Wenzhouxiangella marina]AKS41827.1 hypothetical protein WM2015_1455 [Wenzhouxiangella marina]MBB6086411.1 hypothetical protein [Wenzhouxiangella marina]